MKHKAFLVLIVLGFTFGSMAMANYLEPATTAPGSNTPDVVKTGPGANVSGSRAITAIKSKIGIGDGTTFTGNSFLSTGSYVGTGTGDKGGFAEKLYAGGTTSVIGGSTPKDLLIKINDVGSNKVMFDQYAYGTQYIYPVNANPRMTKALEAIVAGRYISKIAITNNQDVDDIQKRKLNPTNSLEFQPTSGSNAFLPTTNIGLGNSCNLYAPDLGVTAGDGGGCPKGSYMTWYKVPTISGTISSSNNNNGVALATCKQFNPATSPTNTGGCNSVAKVFTNLNSIDKEPPISPSTVCTFSVGYQGANFIQNGKNVKIKWYSLGGNPYRSYISANDDKTYFTYGCGQDSWEVVMTDDYGQFATATR